MRLILGLFALSCLAQPALALPPDPMSEARAAIRDKRFADAATLIEPYLAQNRFDTPARSTYAYALHMSKQYEKSIEAHKQVVAEGWMPPVAAYNIVCAYAQLGKKEEAMHWLQKALDMRFADQNTLESDEEIEPLRSDIRFGNLTGVLDKLPSDPAPGREAGWAWDLDFMVRRMEQMHWDLYAKVSRDAFRTEIETLKKDIPAISDSIARARLARIIAMVGDGHTNVGAVPTTAQSVRRMPVHLYKFSDGIFVIGASKEHESLLGARLLRLGSLTSEEAFTAARKYCSVDNPMGYELACPTALTDPAVLADIGAANSEAGAIYSFRLASGTEKSVELTPSDAPLRPHGLFRDDLSYVHERAATQPLYLSETHDHLRVVPLPDQKAVYFAFQGVHNGPHNDLHDAFEEVFHAVDAPECETLIIDMRLNGGGNTDLVKPFLHGLIQREKVNQRGRLFVIIGRRTFSAAQNTVNLLQAHTKAIFVGEPTGSKPNFVGESTFFILPHSKLRVQASSRYWQYVSSIDQRIWVAPQITAELSFDDYAAGRDPCMLAISAQLSGSSSR